MPQACWTTACFTNRTRNASRRYCGPRPTRPGTCTWPVLAQQPAHLRRPLLAALVNDVVGRPSPLASRVADAPARQRGALIEQTVRQVVAEVLRLEAHRIDGTAGLFDLGLDSLMAL